MNQSGLSKCVQHSVAECRETGASKSPSVLVLINEEMTLTIKGTELELFPSAKLLGLEIDSELSFTPHVEKLCKKLSANWRIKKDKILPAHETKAIVL